MTNTLLRNILLVLALTGITCNAHAEWVLNNNESTIDFISIKKSKVGELHTFDNLRGTLNSSGDATVVISLSSVETLIPIRDDRMKSMLFEVDTFPEAIVSTTVDYDHVNNMEVGESFVQSLPLILSLHGEKKSVDADARIVMLSGSKLLVSTVKPIIINADEFSLGKGVEMLREIAKLPSISSAVPVTVALVFERKVEQDRP